MFATYHPVVCSTTIIVSFAVCLLICSQTALDSKRCVGFSFVMWIVPSFLFPRWMGNERRKKRKITILRWVRMSLCSSSTTWQHNIHFFPSFIIMDIWIRFLPRGWREKDEWVGRLLHKQTNIINGGLKQLKFGLNILLMDIVRQLAIEWVPMFRLLEPFGEITSFSRTEALQCHNTCTVVGVL